MIDRVESFAWLAGEAVGTSLFLAPAVVLIAIAAVALIRSIRRRQAVVHWSDAVTLLFPAVGALLILLCGTAFESDRFHPSTAGSMIINALLLLQFPLCLWVVWRLKAVWSVALPLVILQIWVSLLAWFVSVMAVTGIWL